MSPSTQRAWVLLLRTEMHRALLVLLTWLTASLAAAQAHPGLSRCGQPQAEWRDVTLKHAAEAAPRDGFWFQAHYDGQLGLVAPGPFNVTFVVTDAAGMEVRGTRDATEAGSYAMKAHHVVWRPEEVLAPNATFRIRVNMRNNRAGCEEPAPLERTFEVTTRSELTPAPDTPPLVGLTMGLAWGFDQRCCVPEDTSLCSRPELCLKCWSWMREPMIIPIWGKSERQADPFEYRLFYGRDSEVNSPNFLTRSFDMLPQIVLSTWQTPALAANPPSDEVCLTLAARNFRTAKETTTSVCALLNEPISNLPESLPLPAAVLRMQPDPSAQEVGPPGCTEDAPSFLAGPHIEVAATYTSDPRECFPTCEGLYDPALLHPLPETAPEASAGSENPPISRNRGTPTCAAFGPASHPGTTHWAVAGIWLLCVLRRARPRRPCAGTL